MRRLAILIVLFEGMQLVLPLGTQGQGSQALLSFGFLILGAYTVGEIAAGVGLPKIVGYLLSGVLFGPHVLGAVTEAGATRLAPISELAVAIIAFLAGAELRWAEVRDRGTVLGKIMTVELVLSFVAIAGFVYLTRGWIPPAADLPAIEALAFAMLFAAVAIVHSPAVTMALLTETGAKGPVARTTLGVVLLADVAVVLLFSGVLTFARVLAPPAGPVAGPSLLLVLWEIGGALIIGSAMGAAVAAYLRFVGKDLVLFGVLAAFLGLEVARLAHVELLLTLLMAGFVAENFSEHGEKLRHAMERSAAPIFVVFFALSGAKIELAQVGPLLPLVVPIAIVRGLAIWGGVKIGARWARTKDDESRYVWMGLVSQAGVAIGLAAILAEAYPQRGPYLAGMLLALIAVNESVGPIIFRRALDKSGETGDASSTGTASPASASAGKAVPDGEPRQAPS
jgi:Kef-type K+ transport system membrane component KefB